MFPIWKSGNEEEQECYTLSAMDSRATIQHCLTSLNLRPLCTAQCVVYLPMVALLSLRQQLYRSVGWWLEVRCTPQRQDYHTTRTSSLTAYKYPPNNPIYYSHCITVIVMSEKPWTARHTTSSSAYMHILYLDNQSVNGMLFTYSARSSLVLHTRLLSVCINSSIFGK